VRAPFAQSSADRTQVTSSATSRSTSPHRRRRRPRDPGPPLPTVLRGKRSRYSWLTLDRPGGRVGAVGRGREGGPPGRASAARRLGAYPGDKGDIGIATRRPLTCRRYGGQDRSIDRSPPPSLGSPGAPLPYGGELRHRLSSSPPRQPLDTLATTPSRHPRDTLATCPVPSLNLTLHNWYLSGNGHFLGR
jgi:hypothetical protein